MNIDELVGEWTLISAEITKNGETTSILDPNRSYIKMFTRNRFAFFSRLPNRENFSNNATDAELMLGAKSFDAGTGRFDLNGQDYIEHLDFCSHPNYEGQSIAFKLTYVDEVLTQEGIYPLKRLGFADADGYLVETYKKLAS
ncbi:lipocalin-like domain-containing protein [Maritalea sp.]|uniref:lipocalin-like domain-containing protein n=1 Tax=Maritalea sp. TaxID=2003361 RepID=UPI003EF533DC